MSWQCEVVVKNLLWGKCEEEENSYGKWMHFTGMPTGICPKLDMQDFIVWGSPRTGRILSHTSENLLELYASWNVKKKKYFSLEVAVRVYEIFKITKSFGKLLETYAFNNVFKKRFALR